MPDHPPHGHAHGHAPDRAFSLILSGTLQRLGGAALVAGLLWGALWLVAG